MTADSESDIRSLQAIGRICAGTLRRMMQAVRPGLTTRELDEIGRGLLEAEGARSAQFEHTIIVTKGEPIVLTA